DKLISWLKYGSCETTTCLSLEITTSIFKVTAPVSSALIMPGMVFSGIKPLAPRLPCISKRGFSCANNDIENVKNKDSNRCFFIRAVLSYNGKGYDYLQ